MPSQAECNKAWDEIDDLKVTVSEEPLKEFFPRLKLYNHLSRDKIEAILSCECDKCTTDRRYFQGASVKEYFNKIETGGEDGPSKAILALLIYIRHPSLIRNVLIYGNLCDRSFSSQVNRTGNTGITKESLMNHYWEKMTLDDKHESKFTAKCFVEHMHKFASPVFHSEEFEIYSPSTILPFINERPLRLSEGPGIPINIFQFDIHQHHRRKKSSAANGSAKALDFEFACGIGSFVRKEISPVSTLEKWWQEKENIDLAARTKNPNIIKTCKTYSQNGKFNLIFPYYKSGDLEVYLKSPKTQARVEGDPVWKNFISIVCAIEALGKTQTETPRDQSKDHLSVPSNTEPIMLGYHFDLKPANILVADDGRWIVSDFGQAYFKRGDKSSGVAYQGGTDAYAPPELSNVTSKYLDRYDVFSLGCILLELIAYVVGGPSKRAEFIECRKSTDDRGETSRVWVFNPKTGKPELKNDIKTFMESTMHGCDMTKSKNGRAFLRELLGIAFEMLAPDVTQRLGIFLVRQNLERLVVKYNGGSPQSAVFTMKPVPKDIPATALSDRRYYFYNDADGDPLATDLATLVVKYPDEDEDWVHVEVLRDGRDFLPIKIKRSRHMFVPVYGFGTNVTCDLQKDAQFYLSEVDTIAPKLKNSHFFGVANERRQRGMFPAAFAAQLSLTGQEILLSRTVSTFGCNRPRQGQMTRHVEKFLKATLTLNNDKQIDIYQDIDQPFAATAEIWKEMIPEGLKEHESTVHAYRLAVFSGHSIVLFKCHPEWTIERNYPPDHDKRVLTFKPTNSGKSRTFKASILCPPGRGSYPTNQRRGSGTSSSSSTTSCTESAPFAGIPFSHHDLEDIEKKTIFEVKSFDLGFNDENDAKDFSDAFLYAKEESHKERHP
ncbi:kinase-like protein [Polychaeton citri CBS 116435]|uniref:Kinase-like protein n=1 Tax=Polychaeton citri CBS 116435 TaxID=1314669 RepID=A0A9P4UKP3_9PEZI|nr:kinase-like protein [Polychaeton citri CBS 116435]